MKTVIEFYKYKIVVISHLIGALIAWFAPNDILEKYQVLKQFTEVMQSVTPVISNYAKTSGFPSVTTLYFSLMFLASPLYLLFYKFQLEEYAEKREEQCATGLKYAFAALFLFFIILPGIAFTILYANNGHDFNAIPINSSRLALGIFGHLFAGGMGFHAIATMGMFLKTFQDRMHV